jgi:transcription antitermination factor NusG
MTSNEKITVVESRSGYVVAAPDSMSGWRVVGNPFYSDRSVATVAAAGVVGAIAISAVQEVQEVELQRRKLVRNIVIVDWKQCTGRLASNQNEKWYAVRVTPGMQKMAAPIADEPEHRRGETLIERHLREDGVDFYMPAFWKEIRQHRSRKLRERRFPLLVGYVFIRSDPRKGFNAIREIDGVNSLVTMRNSDGPAVFREDDIRPLMVEMFKKSLEYRYHRMVQIENARASRQQTLHADLGRLLPKGRSRTVSLRFHADKCIEAMAQGARQRVLGIMAALDSLEDDSVLDTYREAV